ncbi:MAG: sigma-54 dependent transcriptional regulator [Acidobacteria bacterium]|nr:sigma-54 dependent transcriptional regulator [Acidobacteriota bacterium]
MPERPRQTRPCCSRGESGTGKELFARALHLFSARAERPFVAINCAAIPENLLESELFGHEKGAFTGAVARKLGKFEVANGGTLFLDEIGDLPGSLQAKILRAVETRSFERVGGTTSITVDVRQVAATNKELRARVAAGLFREDLFFRLSVFPIHIPPLRERVGDVPLLARFFVAKVCAGLGRPTLPLSLAAEEHLTSYAWPGNVRELQNCIERAVILCEGAELRPTDLSLDTEGAHRPKADPWDAIDLSGTLGDATDRVVREIERRKTRDALQESGGNTGRVADALQINHRALLMKMREHGIDP